MLSSGSRQLPDLENSRMLGAIWDGMCAHWGFAGSIRREDSVPTAPVAYHYDSAGSRTVPLQKSSQHVWASACNQPAWPGNRTAMIADSMW